MSGIGSLGTDTLTVERKAAGTWGADGKFAPGATTTTPMPGCSVQEMSGAELQQQPEGRRQREHRVAFTPQALRTADEKNQLPADVVVFEGKRYEVHKVENWTRTFLPHYRCILVKIDGQGGGTNP